MARTYSRRLGSVSRCFRRNEPTSLVTLCFPAALTRSVMSLNCLLHGVELLVDLLLLARDVDDGLGQGLSLARPIRRSSSASSRSTDAEWAWPASREACCDLLLGLLLPAAIGDLLPLLDFLLGQGDLPRLEIVAQRQQLGPRFVGRQLLLATDDFLFRPAPLRQQDHAAGERHAPASRRSAAAPEAGR